MLRLSSALFLLMFSSALSFAAADSALLSLAPSGSRMIAAINVDGSRNSAFGQYFLRQLGTHEDSFQSLIEQTGFDPRRDLQSVVFAFSPSSGAPQGQFAVIARGSFDQSRIKETAQKNGSHVQPFQGVSLYVNGGDNNQTAFAFPDTGLAVMGDLASVKQIIGNRANPVTLDPALQEEISKIEASDAWFASVVPASTFTPNFGPNMDNPAARSQALQSVVRSSGGINFGSTAQMVFNAVTRSPQDAVALADVIRFMASMLQMQRGKEGGASLLAPSVDTMKLNTDGESVHVSLQMPESVLEQLASTHRNMRSGPNAEGRSKPRQHQQ